MSKPTFPDSYRGGMKAFGSLRGAERWKLEHAQAAAQYEEGMRQWLDPDKPETAFRRFGRASCHFNLGLLYAWEGRAEEAITHLAGCAGVTLQHIQQQGSAINPSNNCEFALKGAIAAGLVGQDDLARALFAYAARFAAGLVTGEEEAPASRWVSLAPFIGDAIILAYSQIRLGRVSGFRAMIYPVGFPEANKVEPAWMITDVDALLDTIDTAVEVVRSKRENMDLWNGKKYLLPVLRTLLAHQRNPSSEAAGQAREAARGALDKYYSMIRELPDFLDIYPRVLDLQKAFGQIYGSEAPGVFTKA